MLPPALHPCYPSQSDGVEEHSHRFSPRATRPFGKAHPGHPVLLALVLLRTFVRHTCDGSRLHCHHTRRPENTLMSLTRNGRLSVGCHSRAISGRFSSSERPGRGRRTGKHSRAQEGHPDGFGVLRVRLLTSARHSCFGSREHLHQTIRLEPRVTSFGVRSPFRVGCHSRTTGSRDSARDRPRRGSRLPRSAMAHFGHPPALSPERFPMTARHL